ncbi:amidohydrolase family protein [Porphyrobacter sp. YT40]|uniref:amidohydrolase family protein n=1 Tax=Porphyrobacter sp. YT40 TaxID=2547601 RepID=UPI0015E8E779|nr:amidohydrolase family protein [Porphyrobacter sp. YT40]
MANTSGTYLLDNVQVLDLDGDAAAVRPDMAILIKNGTIAAVMPAGEAGSKEGVAIIDGAGRIAMPGLVDMHVHVWDEASLGAYLAAGVTTIRNASGMPFHLRLADRIARGATLGPRLITTGPILNSLGANAQINHHIVTTADEARAAVRQHHAAGYRRLKVYSNLTREAYEAIRDEAKLLGMTIMGHTPEGLRAPGVPYDKPFAIAFEELLDDGFVTIEHTESVVWHGLRDAHDEDAGRELARRIAAAGVAVDPTLLAFYNLLQVAETDGAYLHRPGTERINPLLVAQSQAEYDRWTAEDPTRHREAFAFYQRMTKMLFEEGVMLVAGSDAGIFTNVPGTSLIEELELLEGAGLSRADVLRAATRNAAIALGEGNLFGRIAPGLRADLILLERDPGADLSALRAISVVIAGGRYLDRRQLDTLLAQAADHDVARTQRHLVEALEAQGIDVAALGL